MQTFTDDQLTLLFDIWEMVRTNDNPENRKLDEKIKNIIRGDKPKIQDFFNNIIDQPNFTTNDHKMLKKFISDWYLSQRTMVTGTGGAVDPFKMTNDQLNEMILSFGFPYPTRIISNQNKALFLLDLVDLYKKKGTPESLARSLQYFGLQNIRVSEWWIHRKRSGEFVARSKVILPKTRANEPPIEIPYESFIANDPYWRLSLSDLEKEYLTSKISLPSLTPHFSIDASISISNVYPVISIISKKMQESYEFWLTTGEQVRDIALTRYGINCSLLELILSIGYLFNGQNSNLGNTIYEYQYDIDTNLDGVDEVDYQTIIDSYNTISAKPLTRQERNSQLGNLFTDFTGKTSDFFLTDYPGGAGELLYEINKELKIFLDAEKEALSDMSALEELLYILDGYLEVTLEITTFSMSHMILGSSTYERLKPIIDFFKPFRSRIRELLTSFLIDEKMQNSIRVDSQLMLVKSIYDFMPEYLRDYFDEDFGYTVKHTEIELIRDYLTDKNLYSLVIKQDHTDDIYNLKEVLSRTHNFYFCDKFLEPDDNFLDYAPCSDSLTIQVIDL